MTLKCGRITCGRPHFGASPFYDSTGIDGGRRTQTHEFRTGIKPYTEDLGRKAQEIPIEAYVLGDDYMTARDNL